MKEEDFKSILKESILEKAPEGLSDRIMDRIAEENVSAVSTKVYSMPGKRLLIFLSILFSGSILYAILNSPANNGRISSMLDSFFNSYSFKMPSLGENELIFNTLNVYLVMAFLAFLLIEFLAFRRKSQNVF